jgi:transposase
MQILALDVGKSKSVAYAVDPGTGECGFTTVRTRPSVLAGLFARHRGAHLVLEIGPMAGWIGDLARASGLGRVQVAHVGHEAWQWRNTGRKTDRTDAVRLAEMAMAGRLPEVHVPEAPTRQWRQVIGYRAKLLGRRTAVKNRIRAILGSVGETLPAGQRGWTRQGRAHLASLARPLADCGPEDLWRGELALELASLEHFDAQVAAVEARLDALAADDPRVAQLRTIPGVGPRLAEMLVTLFDNPHRFRRGNQIGRYLGLVPRQFQSGSMDRRGRITRRGNRLARSLLVEASWVALRYNPRLRAIYERVHRGSRTRRKVAIVAVARRLAVIAWAMLRDGTTWQPGRAGSPTAAIEAVAGANG